MLFTSICTLGLGLRLQVYNSVSCPNTRGVISKDLTVGYGITVPSKTLKLLVHENMTWTKRGTVKVKCIALECNIGLSPVPINAEISMLKIYVYMYKVCTV